MAMSLEDLLAEEGFKGRKSKTMSRASSGPVTARIPTYPFRDDKRAGALSRLKKPERAYSDTRHYDKTTDSPLTNRVKDRRSVDIVRREKVDGGGRSRNDIKGRHTRRGSEDVRDVSGSSFASSRQFSGDEIVEVKEEIERVNAGLQDKGRYKDIYLNGVYSPPSSKSNHSNGAGGHERTGSVSGEDVLIDNAYRNNHNRHLLVGASSGDNYQKNVERPGSSSSRSNRIKQNRENVHDSRGRRPVEVEQPPAEPALDEVAIKAVISIFSGYIKRFLKDQDFRASLHHNCFAALNFTELEEGLIAESKVIINLDQAIETVERAAEERASAKELKKASLQLSMITGLNANDLKDGFTSGIPNSMLSACGHLYLSVIYQLQKKERIAAKHLLQAFCDSPFQARTTLVPELWDNVFYPHLSHLEVWYNQEVASLADDPGNTRKLKQLRKVYDEILDTGTYQFALYYKDWLTEGVKAPTIPYIHVPLVSVQGIQLGDSNGHSLDLGTPANPFSSQPMVSKKLYESVFGGMYNPGTAEAEECQSSQKSDDGIRSSDGSVVEEKRALTYSLESDKYKDLDHERDGESYQEGVLIAQEALELHRANALGGFRDSISRQEGLGSTNMLQTLPIAKVNELTLKTIEKFVFGLQQTERTVDFIGTTLLPRFDDGPYPDFSPTETRLLGEDMHEKYVGRGGRFLLNIPEDYVCPLTGRPFEDPVTLETGQTYERVAIAEWFYKGHITCPVTGKQLECCTVPLTNIILKRVIDGWKSEHSRNLLASASHVAGSPAEQKYKDEVAIFIVGQLLTVFGEEEIMENTKHLIALGGLQFLIRRFAYGDLDEKTSVATMLSCCIKADPGCRNHVASNIEKQGLLEILHCEGVKSRSNAVLLLFELICLSRRKDVNFFLSDLQKEGVASSMHILLVFLQSCSPEQRPLVAVLLLHMDLMVDQQKYSIYREEAVDTITSALDTSLSNEKVRDTCCRALLILGGRISFSGKVMTEDWILKKAGFLDGPESEIQEEQISFKEHILPVDEEDEAVKDWLMTLSASLLCDGKKSFLDSLCKCVSSGHRDMTRVCLTTVAWLSSALASLHLSESQVSAFSALISQLKENLVNGQWVEHKILASVSLLNLSKVPECRDLLMTIAGEIAVPLRKLSEVTWTAKELYVFISQEENQPCEVPLC